MWIWDETIGKNDYSSGEYSSDIQASHWLHLYKLQALPLISCKGELYLSYALPIISNDSTHLYLWSRASGFNTETCESELKLFQWLHVNLNLRLFYWNRWRREKYPIGDIGVVEEFPVTDLGKGVRNTLSSINTLELQALPLSCLRASSFTTD